jgi:glutamate synthase (ferredoxin)
MVDLEPLEDPDDVELVRDLLIQHAGYTGSTIAAGLLSDWDAALTKFVKVMPLDYRRVLQERKRALAQEREAAKPEQLEVSRG